MALCKIAWILTTLFISGMWQDGTAELTVTVSDYSALVDVIKNGQPLHYVVDYLSCLLDGGPSVNASGGSVVEDLCVSGNGVIFFSATKVIYNYQSKAGGYVFDHVETRVFPNGTALITATDLIAPDPNSGSPFYTEVFNCTLGSGLTFYTNEAANIEQTSSYDSIVNGLISGDRVTLVLQDNGEINSSVVDTFESFNEPKYGERHFAWGTMSLAMDKIGKWVKQSKTIRVMANGTVEVTVVDLDPPSLKSLGPVTATWSSFVKGSASFYLWNRVGRESEELLRFRSFIVGHFDNSKQVNMEIQTNASVVHPLSEHISDVATQKVINLPDGFDKDGRFFILEETYFIMQKDNPPTSRPMLFLFSPNARGQVTIVSYEIPKNIPISDIRNNNTGLHFDYNQLTLSKRFNKATYTYDVQNRVFSLGPAATPIPGGMFVLTEKISGTVLSVMEDVIQGGKSIMPYHTPIRYERI